MDRRGEYDPESGRVPDEELIAAMGNGTESSVSGTALAAGVYQVTSRETPVASLVSHSDGIL